MKSAPISCYKYLIVMTLNIANSYSFSVRTRLTLKFVVRFDFTVNATIARVKTETKNIIMVFVAISSEHLVQEKAPADAQLSPQKSP